MSTKTILKRNKIKKRIRKVVFGSNEKPRLSVYRSNKEIYVQLIDDQTGRTIISASSRDKEISEVKLSTKIEIAYNVGKRIGKLAAKSGISQAKFDRGGYLYHGRIKALADGAREGGLKF